MEKELQLKLTVRLYTEDRTRCFGPASPPSSTGWRSIPPSAPPPLPWRWPTPKPGASSGRAENVFGCKMLSSSIGGKGGGGAVLTEEAKRLLAAYDAYVADVTAYSAGKFEEAFGFYRDLRPKGE